MIAILTEWVRDIVFIVLFASFVEILLPNSNMQRFVRAVMGLFVMLAVLGPVVDIVLNWGITQPVPAISMGQVDSVSLDQPNNIVIQEKDRLARKLYQSDLAKQIRALVLATDGVADASVLVELDETQEKYAGQINRINVYIKPGKSAARIAAVQIGQELPPAELDERLTNRIRYRIAELYQLDDSKIIIQRRE